MSSLQPQPERPVSELDRDNEVAVIQEALGAGRLELAEFDTRLAQIYAAVTPEQLHSATADLRPVPHGAAGDVLTIRITGQSTQRAGRWTVPPRIEIRAESSTVELDFVDAVVDVKEIRIEVHSVSSSVALIVPPGWSIDLDDVHVEYGAARNDATAPSAAAVRVHITGHVERGSLVVGPRRQRRRWLRRRRAPS